MDGKIKISIDVMGGENSPDKTLRNSLFVKRYQNKDDYFFIYLVTLIK